LGAVGMVVVFLMLGKATGLNRHHMNIVLAVVGAIIGWFIAFKLRKFIKAASTALIGSFLTIRGFGIYLPGYPNELDMNEEDLMANKHAIFGYLAAFIVLAIIGCVVQLKTQVEEDEEDEIFKNQEESKTCGCF